MVKSMVGWVQGKNIMVEEYCRGKLLNSRAARNRESRKNQKERKRKREGGKEGEKVKRQLLCDLSPPTISTFNCELINEFTVNPLMSIVPPIIQSPPQNSLWTKGTFGGHFGCICDSSSSPDNGLQRKVGVKGLNSHTYV